jgi:hypothetical protein
VTMSPYRKHTVIGRRFRVATHDEEGACSWCGCPLYVGDHAFIRRDGDLFCSLTHAMQDEEYHD